jgi:uncharacterized membrane protein
VFRRLKECGELQIEVYLAHLLRIGVIVAAAVVAVGLGLFLYRYGSAVPDYRVFKGEPADLRSVTAIVRDALDLRRRGLMQLGLLLMIATPVARVAFSVLAFICQRDRAYILVTLIVLGTLLYSMAGGLP